MIKIKLEKERGINVIDKICQMLLNKMKKKMPEIDEERSEIIYYGLQNIIGEIPKFFILFVVAYIFGLLKLTIITYLIMLPYRAASGGFHIKSHIGCLIMTILLFCGTAFLSKSVILEPVFLKYGFIVLTFIFGMIAITKYAPADTDEVPILRKKERSIKKILSYMILSITLLLSIFIKDQVISNIMIFTAFFQTLTITRFMYKLTKSHYGYETYLKQEVQNG